MCRHHDDSWMTSPGNENKSWPLDRLTSLTYRDDRPHQGADHRTTECIRHHRRLEHPVVGSRPREVKQSTDRGRTLALLRERGKVAQSEQMLAGFIHRSNVQESSMDQRVMSAQWIQALGLVTDAIQITALNGREPGIETLRRHRDTMDHHIGGQDTVETCQGGLSRGAGRSPWQQPPAGRVNVCMRHRAAGMDS